MAAHACLKRKQNKSYFASGFAKSAFAPIADVTKSWHGRRMERKQRSGAKGRTWYFPVWLAVMFFATVGLSFRSVTDAVVLCAFGVGLWLNETRAQRPARSFIRLALGSALLFLFLVVQVASWGGDVTMSAIMWVGVTALGAIWTIHYERSEPLV
ncbi:hypothetical protein [Sphingomonas gei]|uniref:hypothetical protein n=1 Tax=Sphingomonas gei TaxID=1395960 RepID=UPI0019D11DF1|nr:hypothetical protein [Sphingomonas gei]